MSRTTRGGSHRVKARPHTMARLCSTRITRAPVCSPDLASADKVPRSARSWQIAGSIGAAAAPKLRGDQDVPTALGIGDQS